MKKVAVLGATGLVGQTFVRLLENHPWFEIRYLVASKKSAGKKFKEFAAWRVSDHLGETEIKSLEEFIKNPDIDLVFSALPASVAEIVEKKLAEKIPVFSNASAHRYEEDVPILIPEVNKDHLELVKVQRKNREWEGFIVTNSNCSTAILNLSLKPISKFGITRVNVATMQAISGSGFRGISAMQIFDNVVPYIEKEELKIENESRKILGMLKYNHVIPANFGISVIATRVPVLYGHTEAIFIELEDDLAKEDLIKAFDKFDPLKKYRVPSSEKPILYNEIPQPKLHIDSGRGMSVTVGRLEKIGNKKFKYIVLGHNLIRGAAGGSILNAEIAYKLGFL